MVLRNIWPMQARETGRFIGSYPAIPKELWGHSQPETVVVVAVVGRVVVAIGNPAVLRVVVPTAAAQHAVGAPEPASYFKANILFRRTCVFACFVKAIKGSMWRA